MSFQTATEAAKEYVLGLLSDDERSLLSTLTEELSCGPLYLIDVKAALAAGFTRQEIRDAEESSFTLKSGKTGRLTSWGSGLPAFAAYGAICAAAAPFVDRLPTTLYVCQESEFVSEYEPDGWQDEETEEWQAPEPYYEINLRDCLPILREANLV